MFEEVLHCSSIGQGKQFPCGSPGPQPFIWGAISLYLQQRAGLGFALLKPYRTFLSQDGLSIWGLISTNYLSEVPQRYPLIHLGAAEWSEERSHTSSFYGYVNWIPALPPPSYISFFLKGFGFSSYLYIPIPGRNKLHGGYSSLLFDYFSEDCTASYCSTHTCWLIKYMSHHKVIALEK